MKLLRKTFLHQKLLLGLLLFALLTSSIFVTQQVVFGFMWPFSKEDGEKQGSANPNIRYGKLSHKVQELERSGQYKEAVPYAEEMLKERENLVESQKKYANLESLLISTLNTVARINYKAGNLDRAEELYKRVLQGGKTAPAMFKLVLAESAEGLSKIYEQRNRKDEAEKFFKDTIKLFEDTFGENNSYNLGLYARAGDFYLKNSRYEESEKYYVKALQAQKNRFEESAKSKSGFDQATSVLSVISSLQKNMSPQKSKNNADTYIGARVLNNLAFVYYKLGQQDKIKSLYQNNFHELQEKFSLEKVSNDFGGTHPMLIPILNNFANLMGSIDQKFSHELFMKVADMNSTLARSSFKTFFADDMKINYLRNSQGYAYSFISHSGRYMQSDDSAVKDTINMWINYKGSVVDFQSKLLYAVKISKDSKVKRKFREYKEAILELSRMSLANEKISSDEYLTLKAKKMGLEIDLSRLLDSQLKNKSIEVREILQALPRNTVYIDFAKINVFDFQLQKSGDEKYFAFIVSPNTNFEVKLIEIGSAKDIDKLVTEYHRALESFLASGDPSRSVTVIKKGQSPDAHHSGKINQIAADLYSKAIKPLEPYIGNRREIIISPDGELNLIPFEVLIGADGKYFVEKYTITYVTSARDILKHAEKSKFNDNAVIIADPDYNIGLNETSTENFEGNAVFFRGNLSIDMKGLSFDRLSDTKDEANNIEKVLRDKMRMSVKNFQDKKASEAALWNVKSPRILHLATHGFFLKGLKVELNNESILSEDSSDKQITIEDPMIKSGLVLSGANASLQSGKDNGIITSDKIVGLDLQDTDLVVLSACSTGVGDIEKGDSVYGLKKAFILAGANSLIVSLWSVPSLETTEMMTEFYTFLSEGKSKKDALRQAKLNMMKKKHNPFYWGAFVMTGKVE